MPKKPPVFKAPGTRRRGNQTVKRMTGAAPRRSDLRKSVTSSIPNYYNEGQIDSLIADMKADIQSGTLRDNSFIAAFNPLNIKTNLLPSESCSYDIGSVEKQFKDLFLCSWVHLYNGGIRWVDDTQRIYFSSILGEDTLNLVAPDTILAHAKIKTDAGIMLNGVLKTDWPTDIATLADVPDVESYTSGTIEDKMILQYDTATNKWEVTRTQDTMTSIKAVNIDNSLGSIETKTISSPNSGMDMRITDLEDIKTTNGGSYSNPCLYFNKDLVTPAMDWFDAQHIDWRPPFEELTNTPSDFAAADGKYLTVSGNSIVFTTFPEHTISTSTDVNTAGASANDILKFNGTNWEDSNSVDLDTVTADTVEGSLLVKVPNDLLLHNTTYDVSSLGSATSGEVLRSSSTSDVLEWVHMPTQLSDLSDVSGTLNPNNNDLLKFTGTEWISSQDINIDDIIVSNELQAQIIRPTKWKFTNGSGSTDTFATPTDTATENQVLRVTNAADPFELSWVDMSMDTLSDTDLSSADPATGSLLRYNGTKWVDTRNITSLTSVTSTSVNATNLSVSDDLQINGNTYDISGLASGSTGQVLSKGAGGTLEWKNDAQTTEFTDLNNTPNSYTGAANKYLKVNNAEDGISFVASAGNWDHQVAAHIIPDTDEAYDLGSATYRFRDLYGSLATMWLGDFKLTIEDSKFKVKKRKLDQVPAIVAGLGGTSGGALTHSGEGTLAAMSMAQWEAYASTLGTPTTRKAKDIWVAKGAAGYSDADYETIDSTSSSMGGTMDAHIIPDTNAAYDLGNAEYKIRHLFLSDNSLWIGDDHKIDIDDGGKMKFKKRKKSVVPAKITGLGGDQAGAEAHSGTGIANMTVAQWLAYGQTLDAGLTLEQLFPAEGAGGFTNDDWEQNGTMNPEGHAGAPPVTGNVAAMAVDLHLGGQTTVVEPQDNFGVDIIGAMEGIEGKAFEVTINILQGGAPANINTSAITINGAAVDASKVTAGTVLAGTPNELNMLKLNCVFVNAAWYVIVTAFPHA